MKTIALKIKNGIGFNFKTSQKLFFRLKVIRPPFLLK
jgi:hypothetical protein